LLRNRGNVSGYSRFMDMRVLLIVYDNDSYIPFFPQGIAYLAAALAKGGHHVSIYHQDIHHWPKEHLTHFLNTTDFDMVGLGFVAGYYQFRKAQDISRAISRSRRRSAFTYVLGGHGPAAEPRYFLEKMQADFVVVGEGEGAILDIADGGIKKETILAYDLAYENIDDYPWPAYDFFPSEPYRRIRFPLTKRNEFAMPILTGRGCRFRCTFCYRMDTTFRPRSPEAVIEEMKFLHNDDDWRISHFQFSDELFMSSGDRINRFCTALLSANVHKWASWDCNGRLNFANEPNLSIMKRAGCRYINYGIEALDDEVLEKMNKHLTVEQIIKGVEATKKAGIYPGLNFMWGNIGDTKTTLKKAVKFLLKYDGVAELRTIRPVTPYPGSKLYQRAINERLLGGPEDFYEAKHRNSDLATVTFTGIPDKDFNYDLFLANWQLLDGYYHRCLQEAQKECADFYDGKNPGFRGFRAV